jgi:uncharacterized membrane protein YeiH
VLWFDAAALALFAVTGAHKAILYGLNPITATLLGMLTGIGGGMTRDILLAEIPTVLRADLYAVAALAGAAVVVIAKVLQFPAAAQRRWSERACASRRRRLSAIAWFADAQSRCSDPASKRRWRFAVSNPHENRPLQAARVRAAAPV